MNPQILDAPVSEWGEGPVWWEDQLGFVDISGRKFILWSPDAGITRTWEMDQRIGFALPCSDGRWIWGGDHGIYFLNPGTAESEKIHDPESGIPDNRFNDAGISPDGRLFAGTIAMNKTEGSANLYRMDPDLSCRRVYPGVTNSNGIGWSPDGKYCYYIDTPTYQIRRFDYSAETGGLSNEKRVFSTKNRIPGVPDGMCVDAEGMLWIAFCHGGCVVNLHPESGEVLKKMDFPTPETTSCCFGGAGLTDLYVTTGKSAKATDPDAGRLFVIRNAGKGIPQPPFSSNMKKNGPQNSPSFAKADGP